MTTRSDRPKSPPSPSNPSRRDALKTILVGGLAGGTIFNAIQHSGESLLAQEPAIRPELSEKEKTMTTFYAGRARIDITPTKLPIIVNGQFEERWFNEIGDPLSVRAFVFRKGDLRIAMAVVDTCMMSAELIDSAKRLKIGRAHV